MGLFDFSKHHSAKLEEFPEISNELYDFFLDEIKSNPQACMLDEIPQGFGRFGLVETNPIPVFSIISNDDYLNILRTLDGQQISYERKGSIEIKNISKPIDKYEISNLKGDVINRKKITLMGIYSNLQGGTK